jgi:hypothetical protein
VIRHIAIFTLKDGADLPKITKGVELLRDTVPGPLRTSFGRDAGLKAGNGGFGVAFDFPDEKTYQTWDAHPEHERIRRELIFPEIAGVYRCQFRVDER